MDKDIIYSNKGVKVRGQDVHDIRTLVDGKWIRARSLIYQGNEKWVQFIGCNPTLDEMVDLFQYQQTLVVKGVLESFAFLCKVYGFNLLGYTIGLSDFTQVNQLIRPRIDYSFEGDIVRGKVIELKTNSNLNYLQEDVIKIVDSLQGTKGQTVKVIKSMITDTLEENGYVVTYIMQNSSNIHDDTIINIRFNLSLTAFKDGVLTGISNYPINAK